MFVIRSVLSNAQHPEYGSIPVEFPITDKSYDHMVERIGALGIGCMRERDCKIDRLNSWYSVLQPMKSQSLNIDEIDYLAKRWESFVDYKAAQFQSMTSRMQMSKYKGFNRSRGCFDIFEVWGKEFCLGAFVHS